MNLGLQMLLRDFVQNIDVSSSTLIEEQRARV